MPILPEQPQAPRDSKVSRSFHVPTCHLLNSEESRWQWRWKPAFSGRWTWEGPSCSAGHRQSLWAPSYLVPKEMLKSKSIPEGNASWLPACSQGPSPVLSCHLPSPQPCRPQGHSSKPPESRRELYPSCLAQPVRATLDGCKPEGSGEGTPGWCSVQAAQSTPNKQNQTQSQVPWLQERGQCKPWVEFSPSPAG